MNSEVFKPNYKVSRHGNGLYSVTTKSNNVTKIFYIQSMANGSRKVYYISTRQPLFPTLRDAILHVI